MNKYLIDRPSGMELSNNDARVLNTIFDPLNSGIGIVPMSRSDLSEEESESDEWNREEVKAIALAELGKLQEAMELIDTLLMRHGDQLSLLNNRAQMHLMKRDWKLALSDLDKAID
eukprot:Partr_v1_DN27895_c0_g1_i8_m22952